MPWIRRLAGWRECVSIVLIAGLLAIAAILIACRGSTNHFDPSDPLARARSAELSEADEE